MRQLNKWQRERQAQKRFTGLSLQLKKKSGPARAGTGVLGIPVTIKKGRDAPKWQTLNETQKQYKSLQIVKSLYGNISHKNLLITSNKAKGFANIVSKLETRLDVLVYRLQFANSLSESRDLIRKGFICINSKPMTFSGYFVENGSLISSTHLSSVLNRISHRKHSISMPHFLFHTSYLSGILLYNPNSITPLTETPIFPFFKFFNAKIRPSSSARALF